MAIDTDKLQEFLGRFVTDLGATFAAGNVVTGHHLGLYGALADGPARAAELAERTGTNPRYVAEWLRGQAAGRSVGLGGRENPPPPPQNRALLEQLYREFGEPSSALTGMPDKALAAYLLVLRMRRDGIAP